MKAYPFLASGLMVLVLPLVACGKKPAETAAAPEPKRQVLAAEVAQCQPDARRHQALSEGMTLLAGVSLTEVTPIAELVDHPEAFAGKKVLVEGPITEVCQEKGCWAALRTPDGKVVRLKVRDGVIDFRTNARPGAWAIGEGTLDPKGPHGLQVRLTGGKVGTVLCEAPPAPKKG